MANNANQKAVDRNKENPIFSKSTTSSVGKNRNELAVNKQNIMFGSSVNETRGIQRPTNSLTMSTATSGSRKSNTSTQSKKDVSLQGDVHYNIRSVISTTNHAVQSHGTRSMKTVTGVEGLETGKEVRQKTITSTFHMEAGTSGKKSQNVSTEKDMTGKSGKENIDSPSEDERTKRKKKRILTKLHEQQNESVSKDDDFQMVDQRNHESNPTNDKKSGNVKDALVTQKSKLTTSKQQASHNTQKDSPDKKSELSTSHASQKAQKNSEDDLPSGLQADGRISQNELYDSEGNVISRRKSNTQDGLHSKSEPSTSTSHASQQAQKNSEDEFPSCIRADGRFSKYEQYDSEGNVISRGKANTQDGLHSKDSRNGDLNRSRMGNARSSTVSDVTNQEEAHHSEEDFNDLIEVKSSRSSIVDLEVDVIVSSESTNLRGGGMVARIVQERGGQHLTQFKESILIMCQNVPKWSFQPTPGTGNLKCKHVFHAVVPQYSDCEQHMWAKQLQSLVEDILHRTECLGHGSVAIPILGCGKNTAPFEFVVDLFCSAIEKFVADRKSSTTPKFLKTINLVHPDKDVENYIRQKIEMFQDKSRTKNRKKKSASKSKKERYFLDVTDKKSDTCPICMEELKASKLKALSRCYHVFCENCLQECFKRTPACPVCNLVYGELRGNQPESGFMLEVYLPDRLPAYPDCGTIKIFYYFQNGLQTKEHPKPGSPYRGTKRTGYLPDNPEGQKVHRLFRRAFEQRLMFTIGNSRTTGREDVVTWNDIHHKTSTTGGPEKYGYPDPSYLSRVLEELAAKGLTED